MTNIFNIFVKEPWKIGL